MVQIRCSYNEHSHRATISASYLKATRSVLKAQYTVVPKATFHVRREHSAKYLNVGFLFCCSITVNECQRRSHLRIKERTSMIPSYEFVSPSNGTFPLIVVSVLTYVALFIYVIYVTSLSGPQVVKGRKAE